MARSRTQVRTVNLAPYRQPSPIIRIATPRASTARVPKRRHGRRRGGDGAGGSPMQLALAAGVYGLAKKAGLLDKLPEIPMLGRTGTAALILWYWSRHGGGPWVRKGAIVAAVLAGYQLGAEGKVTGDGDGFVTGDYAEGDYE